MHVTELMDILRGYPEDWEVELALVAPYDEADEDIAVDRYSIEGVLPWEDEEEGATRLWLVGGEDDNVDAFLDVIDGTDDGDVTDVIHGTDVTAGTDVGDGTES